MNNTDNGSTCPEWKAITIAPHQYKLSSLVEITDKSHAMYGCRLFVVKHTADKDGKPLYDLSFDSHAQKAFESFNAEHEKAEDNTDEKHLAFFFSRQAEARIVRNFKEENLLLIWRE